MYDPFTKRVFTMNGRSANTTAIDAKTDKVVGTESSMENLSLQYRMRRVECL